MKPHLWAQPIGKKLAGVTIALTVLSLASAAIAQTYQLGDTSPGVTEIQRELRVPQDGVYGSETEAAVRDFQERNGLQVDGVAGRETLRALGLENLIDGSVSDGASRSLPYVVVVPGGDRALLERVRRAVDSDNVSQARSRLGAYVNAGGFRQRSDAERQARDLRRQGFNARVSYRP